MSSGELPPIEDPCPEVMTREQIRFEISFAISQVAKSIVWDWARTDRLKKEAARERIIDVITVRFERLQVRRGPPVDFGFHLIGASSSGPGGRKS